MNRPDDINLSREGGEALIERLETQTCTAEDLRVVAQVVRLYFWLFTIFEARPKSFHNRPLCAFDDCVHFVDHTPSAESA